MAYAERKSCHRITQTPITTPTRKRRAQREYSPALSMENHTAVTLLFDAGILAAVFSVLAAVALIAA